MFSSFFLWNVHWKDWCCSWNSNTLATWCEELTHWKRPWCWQRLKAGEEGDNRGWDGWLASLTWWTWVWASSRSWWRTGKPGVLQSMGSQRDWWDWATELKGRRYSKCIQQRIRLEYVKNSYRSVKSSFKEWTKGLKWTSHTKKDVPVAYWAYEKGNANQNLTEYHYTQQMD